MRERLPEHAELLKRVVTQQRHLRIVPSLFIEANDVPLLAPAPDGIERAAIGGLIECAQCQPRAVYVHHHAYGLEDTHWKPRDAFPLRDLQRQNKAWHAIALHDVNPQGHV